jgi:hypothetical protein
MRVIGTSVIGRADHSSGEGYLKICHLLKAAAIPLASRYPITMRAKSSGRSAVTLILA